MNLLLIVSNAEEIKLLKKKIFRQAFKQDLQEIKNF